MSPEKQVKLLRSFEGTVPTHVITSKIMDASKKQMEKEVKKAVKKGNPIPTVGELTKTIKDTPVFAEYCDELGLDMNFFEGLAEGAIKGVS